MIFVASSWCQAHNETNNSTNAGKKLLFIKILHNPSFLPHDEQKRINIGCKWCLGVRYRRCWQHRAYFLPGETCPTNLMSKPLKIKVKNRHVCNRGKVDRAACAQQTQAWTQYSQKLSVLGMHHYDPLLEYFYGFNNQAPVTYISWTLFNNLYPPSSVF